MIFLENRLPADDSHEISCLICYFLKSGKILNCRLLQIIGGALRVNLFIPLFTTTTRDEACLKFNVRIYDDVIYAFMQKKKIKNLREDLK